MQALSQWVLVAVRFKMVKLAEMPSAEPLMGTDNSGGGRDVWGWVGLELEVCVCVGGGGKSR